MAINGSGGSVTANTNTVGTAKIWSLDITQDTVETTNFASNGWKETTPTLKGFSGTVTTIFDGAADTGEASLVNGVFDGATVALELLTSATGSGTAEKFSGNAVITSMPVTNDVNGVIEVTFAFEGTGELTKSALS